MSSPKIKVPNGSGYDIAGTNANLVDITDEGNLIEATEVESAIQEIAAKVNTKAPIASPVFTGNVELPNTTSIGDVSSTEIGYLDGVTSPIQTQLDTKETVTRVDAIADEISILKGNVEDSPSATIVNLGYGHQVINMPRTAPYNVLDIRGHTLVNLLGRDGNFETLTPNFNVYQGSVEVDTVYKTTGSASNRFIIGTGFTFGTINRNVAMVEGKKYILIADIMIGNNGSAYIQVMGENSNIITDNTKFRTSWMRFTATSSTHLLELIVTGSQGQLANFDAVRIYEISTVEYNEIPNMSEPQIAIKYPYVDDMKPITNPYVLAYGENLLPPFTEWTLDPLATVLSPYTSRYFTVSGGAYGTGVHLPVLPNQVYTLSVGDIISNDNGSRINYDFYDKNMTIISANYGLTKSNPSKYITFTTPDNCAYIGIYLVVDVPGTHEFYNPMLNHGNTPKPFKPRHDQMQVFPMQLASNVDGSIADQLYRRGSEYWVERHFKTMDLDGKLDWKLNSLQTGYKIVTLSVSKSTSRKVDAVKYDGKILISDPSIGVGDNAFLSTTMDELFLLIDNSDSGWGQGYGPSQAEIKACFNGWRMGSWDAGTWTSPYTSGTGAWVPTGITSNFGNYVVTTVPTTESSVAKSLGWTPYKLQYQLKNPVTEQIIPEGEITLHEGLNHIEVGNGMIVREKTNPSLHSGYYYINNSGIGNSALSRRTDRIVGVYKSNVLDSWGKNNGFGANIQQAYKSENDFDPSAAYTVTYLALDQYSLTSNILAIQGEYAANLKTQIDELALDYADLATRVSVVETQKVNKVQPQWITPTLLNGWANFSPAYENASYMKDELGYIHIRGAVMGGANNSIIFYLPRGYRPPINLISPTVSESTGNKNAANLEIVASDGRIIVSGGGSSWTSLNIPPFLAEQ